MNQNLGHTARRFDPNLFDCELPQGVRAELLRPKRPRILLPPDPPEKRSRRDSSPSWPNAAMLGICALFFAIACLAVVGWFANKPTARIAPVVQHASAPVVQPTPAVTPTYAPAPVLQAPRATVPA